MAKLQYRTLSNRTVERLKVEKDTVFWDRELTGFGVQVYPTGGKVYVIQARGPEDRSASRWAGTECSVRSRRASERRSSSPG